MRATVAVRPIGIPGDERRRPQGTGTVHVHASVADREVGFPGAERRRQPCTAPVYVRATVADRAVGIPGADIYSTTKQLHVRIFFFLFKSCILIRISIYLCSQKM